VLESATVRWRVRCRSVQASPTYVKGAPMAFRMLCSLFFLFAIAIFGTASVGVQVPGQTHLAEHEREVWSNPIRVAEFSDVPHVSAHPQCENILPPQALATPDPLLDPAGPDAKVKISFIVGADGRVHGPLILESAGPVRDSSVLRTLRTWRYRPATCNGAPTDAEGRIEFFRR
jgi:Gram-negative bacterial TonB protein C-terminal